MANIEIKNPPEYMDKIRKLEPTDKSHADIFNNVFKELLNNDVFLKDCLETLQEKLMKSGILSDALQNTCINDTFTFEDLISKKEVTFFTNWTDNIHFPNQTGSGMLIPGWDTRSKLILYSAIPNPNFRENHHTYIAYVFKAEEGDEVETEVEWKQLMANDEISNQNLLVNSNFKINEKEEIELTGSGEKQYICDGWWHYSVVPTDVCKYVNNHIILYSGRIGQNIENLESGIYTVTVKILNSDTSCNIYVGADKYIGTVPAKSGIYSFKVELNGEQQIFIQTQEKSNSGVVFEWIKLELGNASTPFIFPNYEVELLKCRGYTKASNPNLLINPDFQINQRNGYIVREGATVYFDQQFTQIANASISAGYKIEEIYNNYGTLKTKEAENITTLYAKKEDIVKGYVSENIKTVYTVDRWRMKGHLCTLVIDEDGLIITKHSEANKGYAIFCSIIEDKEKLLEGKELMLSAEINNKVVTLYVPSGWQYDSTEKDLSWRTYEHMSLYLITTPTNELEIRFYIGMAQPVNTSFQIKWAKLELGAAATPFVPPATATELVKCQYYFQTVEGIYSPTVWRPGKIVTYIHPPIPMRTIPTMSFKNTIFNTIFPKSGVCITNEYGSALAGYTFSLGSSYTTESSLSEFSLNAEKENHEVKGNNLVVIGKDNPVFLDAEFY